MKELDAIFTAFAQEYLETLTPEELQEYEDFLNLPEAELYEYFIQQCSFPAHFSSLSIPKKIQQFVQKNKTLFIST